MTFVNHWELPDDAEFVRDKYSGWYHICYYRDKDGNEYAVRYYSEVFHES